MKEIEQILRFYNEATARGERLALGTVVKVEASSYRRVGARMLVSHTGRWVGGISGGCLEGDALKKAQFAMARDQASVVVYDTLEDDEHQLGVGLGCNGRIEVLFVPIDPQQSNNSVSLLGPLVKIRKPTVVLQVLASDCATDLRGLTCHSSNYQQLLTETGLKEKEITNGITEALEKGKSLYRTIINEIGVQSTIFFEYLRPRMRLLVIGDNYDVEALLSMSQVLGWEVYLGGSLRKFTSTMRTAATLVSSYEDAQDWPVDAYTALLLMSHDYRRDCEALRHFYDQPLPYIGLLGPRKRMQKLQAELGIDLENDKRVFAPVGLDIGAETPEEIALAMAAEIIAHQRQCPGVHLRLREGSIHR